jgi:hypothetical protein
VGNKLIPKIQLLPLAHDLFDRRSLAYPKAIPKNIFHSKINDECVRIETENFNWDENRVMVPMQKKVTE